MSLPLCPKCGAPARIALVLKARVRCELTVEGNIGPVRSLSRDSPLPYAFECGGGHTWTVGEKTDTLDRTAVCEELIKVVTEDFPRPREENGILKGHVVENVVAFIIEKALKRVLAMEGR